MSGIDKVTPQSAMTINTQARVERQAGESDKTQEQKDSVNISGGESLGKKIVLFPARAVKEVVGIAHGTVSAALGVIPSALGGIQAGLTTDKPDAAKQVEGHKGEAEAGYGIGYALEIGAAGAVAGGMMGGPWGVAIGGVGGLILGGIKMAIDGATGALHRVDDKISQGIYNAIADNTPTGDKMYDAGKDIAEGGILGVKDGVKESFNLGREKGKATLDGVWEGTKGAVRTILSRDHEAPATEEAKPQTFGERFKEAATLVIGLPKEILKAAFGTAAGTVGAVLAAPYGLLEGIGQGATHKGDVEHIEAGKRTHKVILNTECVLIGAAAGAIGGPFGMIGGGIAGAVGGLLVGYVLGRIEKATGTDKEIAENMTKHLRREVSDNNDLGSKVANGHRDVIEGAMVGTAAGIKEGFGVGYDTGAGFVQGVSDSIVGVAKGLKGAFSTLNNYEAPAPQAKTEE
ncbi:MAG: hypothetical protein AB9903_34990 [Vulcanimicrobiota bacterium]